MEPLLPLPKSQTKKARISYCAANNRMLALAKKRRITDGCVYGEFVGGAAGGSPIG